MRWGVTGKFRDVLIIPALLHENEDKSTERKPSDEPAVAVTGNGKPKKGAGRQLQQVWNEGERNRCI